MNNPIGSVQSTYDRYLSDGLPGSGSDVNPTVKESFIAEGGDIPYGVVISRGSVEENNGNTQTGRLGKTGQLAATFGYASGTGIINEDMAFWNAISDGSFEVSIDGVANDITGLDFTGAADLAAVGVIIQAAIQAIATGGFTAALVAYNGTSFAIVSGTTGAASSVSDLSDVSPAAGTPVSTALGLDTANNVSGDDATGLVILGVTYRSLTSEANSLQDSGNTSTKEGEIGVVQREGTIKVLSVETAADNGAVYYDDVTGAIYANAGTGRTLLGSAKFRGAVQGGKVGIIDITGVRGA